MNKNLTETNQIPLETIINQCYSSNILNKLYRHYLSVFFNRPKENLLKAELIRILAQVYSSQDIFQRLLAFLPGEVKEILNLLVWEGGKHEVKKLEKMFKTEIIKKGSYHGNGADGLTDPYLLFLVSSEYTYNYSSYNNPYTYYLYLSDKLRNLFRQYLPPPKEYNLIPLDTFPKTEFVYEDKEHILKQINLLVTYIQYGNLKFSKSRGKIRKNSMKQMVEYCDMNEFYDSEDQNLAYMKFNLMIDFLMGIQIKHIDNPALFLKQLFDRFFSSKGFKENYYLINLLNYLKGNSYYYYVDQEEKIRESLSSILKALLPFQWVSIESVIKYALCREIYLEVVDKSVINTLYYCKKHTSRYSSNYQNTYISEGTYKDIIMVPFIKAAMFLFSSFGLIDIAYNFPGNGLVQEKDYKYLSIYDGLKYIRLTQLGEYVLGLTSQYEVKFEEEKANIILDEKMMIIHLEGKNRLKGMALEKIGERISDNHYRVDYNSFLKDCLSKEDIYCKIDLFKSQICLTPPLIWQDFLDEVQKKINPLIAEQGMVVYRLKADKELISLMAKDEVLKECILKAEDYHLIINSKKLNKVKNRLREFGYFIDNI